LLSGTEELQAVSDRFTKNADDVKSAFADMMKVCA
jgi:hypothetical protein